LARQRFGEKAGVSAVNTTTRSTTFQVRFHGRGGQGVVTAAELLSVAAFLDGRHSQAFPSFGSERQGAPVVAFCRIADSEIRTRAPVDSPDALVVQDPTLLHDPDLLAGLEPGGLLLLNSAREATDFHQDAAHIVTVPATELAMAHLGRPLPNAVLLGALSGLTGVVSLESVHAAIAERFRGATAEANIAAASDAFKSVGGDDAAPN
jgi:pyruvate ferredoxin oxidoreductase gamma subunit